MQKMKFQLAILPAMATVMLSGCMVGPKYSVPPATATAPPASYKESPTQFPETDGWKVAQPDDAMLRGKWWEIYNDPELNALEERLNVDNQNIKQAFENFMEARTLIAQARSQLFPTIGTTPAYTRSRGSANVGGGSAATGAGTAASLFDLPISASWEPDLWGKVRSQIHQAQANAQLSAADLENERLTEQATLAIVFFQIRGQDALIQLYQDTVKQDQTALDIARSAHDVGTGDQITVVEAENTLQNAQSSLISLGVARAQDEHAIAMLIGTNPSSFSIPVKSLNANPPTIPIGVPSKLLERRPDIAASERNMAAANAQIGIGQAAYYPSLDITAGGGLESSTLKHLFDVASRFWSVGPSVSETIYDGGLRRAVVYQYIATYNADVAGYRQTVLAAFQQVEDQLAAVRILTDQVHQQEAAVKSAQEYVDLETGRFNTGIDPYVDVVTAKNTLLADQQTLATLHIQTMTSSVQLIESLGGGWDRSQLPSTADVSKHLAKSDYTIQK
jgi:NodT family efflux transporter outer membrane factor (OMF) lipoprotein